MAGKTSLEASLESIGCCSGKKQGLGETLALGATLMRTMPRACCEMHAGWMHCAARILRMPIFLSTATVHSIGCLGEKATRT